MAWVDLISTEITQLYPIKTIQTLMKRLGVLERLQTLMGERWKKINLLHFCLFTLAPSHRTSAQSHALRQSHHAPNKTTPLRQSHHAPTKLRRSMGGVVSHTPSKTTPQGVVATTTTTPNKPRALVWR